MTISVAFISYTLPALSGMHVFVLIFCMKCLEVGHCRTQSETWAIGLGKGSTSFFLSGTLPPSQTLACAQS